MRKSLFGLAGLTLAFAGRDLLARRRQLNPVEDLRGQVVLVTGGSRGLGFLLAREFGREGCRVAICARDEGELERAQADLEREGAEVITVPCDVSDQGQVERMIAEVTRRFGPIDILVNNAGIIQVGPAHTMRLEDYEAALGVMFWGVVYPTLAVLPQMRARRAGRIVNITSIGGKVSIPHLLPYSSAKFGAVGFSEGLRAELARDGITVVTIAPGLMRTGSHLNATFKGQQEIEFALFSPLASLPIISMDAERAARQIVAATKRGEADRVLTVPANLLALFHGMFPGLTADILGIVNNFLPSADESQTAQARGMEVQARLRSRLLDMITFFGQSAARRFHEYPDAPPAGKGNGQPRP